MVIDVFSKYGWIRGLKDKKTETVSKAFGDVFKSKRKPQMLWTDKGSEFISKHFKDFLKSKGIKLYHTENEEKSSVVERWNKTMKNRIWKMFTVNNNTVYWNKIDKLVDDYNNARHSSIKMTPVEASKKRMKVKFGLIYMVILFTRNLVNQLLRLAIKLEFQSIRGRYLIKVTPQTGQRKYLLLIKFYQQNQLHIALSI